MVDIKQAKRAAEVITPVGKDKLVLRRLEYKEQLSTTFEVLLQLTSTDFNIDPCDLLGHPLTTRIDLARGVRYVHGLISEFQFTGTSARLALYTAKVRPWTWILSHRRNCRIFQNKTVPDIIKDVVRDSGFEADLKEDFSGNYQPRVYCVQYNESDFDFISRLMEEEGIYYFFQHEKDRHVLVMCDWSGAHSSAPNCDSIIYYPESDSRRRDSEHIYGWRLQSCVVPGASALVDYDFCVPQKDLQVASSKSLDFPHGDREVFEWPGGYTDRAQGDTLARVRLEDVQTGQERAFGRCNVRALESGRTFSLTHFPRDDQNKAYLVISANHTLQVSDYLSGAHIDEGTFYECEFEALDLERPFRPTRRTTKPRSVGPQTAVVVGPSGDEIFTDPDGYGRIKVQFPWDRLGKRNESSSCWIRVAQPWAASNWGAQHIPRIGQEVLVHFLDGDPDKPMILGAVYNGDNKPPFALPGNKTQSGIRSNSSKGGGGSNEIRFEDAKGSEQIFIHAQKNEDIIVENDATRKIGANRTKTVGSNENCTVGVNREQKVGANETLTVGANQSATIGANRTENVGGMENVTIAALRSHIVGAADNLAVGAAQGIEVAGARAVTVGGLQQHTVGATDSTTIGGSQSLNVGGKRSATIGSDQTETVGGNETISIGGNESITIAKNWSGSAGDSITFKTGSATVTMKKDGTIVIQGKDITINASGDVNIASKKKISLKASGDIVMKGNKILQN